MHAFILGIFSEARGVIGMKKSLHLPIKGGARARVKRIQTFLELVLLAERFTVSLRPNLVLERVENSTRVRVVIRIFRVSPNKHIQS
jgi:hypothetical protein